MESSAVLEQDHIESPLFERRWRSLQGTTSTLKSEVARLKQQNRMLRKLIFTDPLTGLCNRMALERAFIARWSDFPKGAVVVFDLDRFKSINDQNGHETGDRVLQCFGHIIRSNIRTEDLAVRYGGEEFVLLVQDSDIDHAFAVAERIRKATERYAFPSNLRVTVSGGVAAGSPPNWDELFPRADQALYQAKATSRNKIIAASSIVHLKTA